MGKMNWRPIQRFEGLYEVSDQGTVRRLPGTCRRCDGKILPILGSTLVPGRNECGYWHVSLSVASRRTTKKVHRLVAEAFLRTPLPGEEINHRDGDKSNNQVNNLEWVTKSENIRHAVRTGLHRWTKRSAS